MSNSNVSAASQIDVAVIGGGQSALAVAYFLRRAGVGYGGMHGIHSTFFPQRSGVRYRDG
jgi:thioredoxin reductase